MKSVKWLGVGLAVVALGAGGAGVATIQSKHEAGEARAAAMRRNEEMRGALAVLEKKLATETKRAEAVESDNAVLASAVHMVQTAITKAAQVESPAILRETFTERIKRVLTAARAEDSDAALSELLACYRLASARPNIATSTQLNTLVEALGKFGERHPEVPAELKDRFEKGKQRVVGNGDDTEPLNEMATIAKVLKSEQLMVAVWDAIPAGDPRRVTVGIYAADGMIEAKRYREAMEARSYASMSSALERGRPSVSSARGASTSGNGATYLATDTAKNIEILAGAGDLAHARELAGRLFAVDGSEATRALVQKHLERAGQAGLLKDAGK